jgi:nicotinamidase-related amidase
MDSWVYEVLDPKQTAIMVVDVQHDFCGVDGSFAQNGMNVAAGRSILAPLAEVLREARSSGARPVYLRFVEDPAGRVVSAAYDRQRYKAGAVARYCIEERGKAIVAEVAPLPDEPVIDKVRASGFFNTALDTVLRCAGIHTIVMTGMATDSCVLATAIDATARDYYVVLVPDCLASFSEERHLAALNILSFKHPSVAAGELIRLWQAQRESGLNSGAS